MLPAFGFACIDVDTIPFRLMKSGLP